MFQIDDLIKLLSCYEGTILHYENCNRQTQCITGFLLAPIYKQRAHAVQSNAFLKT